MNLCYMLLYIAILYLYLFVTIIYLKVIHYYRYYYNLKVIIICLFIIIIFVSWPVCSEGFGAVVIQFNVNQQRPAKPPQADSLKGFKDQ